MRRPRRWFMFAAAAALAWCLLAPAAAAHASQSFESLCERLEKAAAADPAVRAGVVLVDLASDARCSVSGDRPFRSGSLYKTVLAAELFRQVRAGDASLDDTITVVPDDFKDDPVEFRQEASYRIRASEALRRMITISDNASANALRRRLGLAEVAAAPGWLGLPSTTVSDPTSSTPSDQADLYRAIYHGEVVDPAASQALLHLLLDQRVDMFIPGGLPEGTRIAHKTGTVVEFANDAGIVYAPGGDFVLVVMTQGNGGDYDAARAAMSRIAAVAYEGYAVARPMMPDADAPPPEAPASRPDAGADGAPQPAAALAPVAAAVAPPPATVGTDASGVAAWMGQTGVAGVTAGVLVMLLALVGLPVAALRRRNDLRYRAVTGNPAVEHIRADRSERGSSMRFGSRRDDDARTPPAVPASRSVAEVAPVPVQPSRRLQRIAEHFRSQGELLAAMRAQFEDEMEPLHELIVKQSQVMHALLQNLEERLRPLNEYADGEEANLAALHDRIDAGGRDHVARSFSAYMEDQRRRIETTREQIDGQRVPFLEYGDAQRETVETALARFDQDMQALEDNLAEQRRVMMRMLDAMRSETFAAVKQYLEDRQETLARLAAEGSTDPLDIGRALQGLRANLMGADTSDHVRAVLEHAEEADRALMEAGPQPSPPPAAPPRAIREGREGRAAREDAAPSAADSEASA